MRALELDIEIWALIAALVDGFLALVGILVAAGGAEGGGQSLLAGAHDQAEVLADIGLCGEPGVLGQGVVLELELLLEVLQDLSVSQRHITATAEQDRTHPPREWRTRYELDRFVRLTLEYRS